MVTRRLRPSRSLRMRWQHARSALPAALLLALGLAGCADDSAGSIQSQKLASVKSRGQLVCGVDGRLPGFSFVQPDGSYRGLDVDICRAVAAAVLGDPERVQFRDLNASERFAALASGEVDLLSRNTTLTLSRDASGGNGLSFAPVVFYDGQGVMTPRSSGVRRLQDLAGQPICVESGTTTELNLADRMRELGATYMPLKFQASDQTYAAYLQGRCAAITSDRSQLAARRTGFPDPASHTLLPEVLSKEPLAPATVNGDAGWADAVRWTLYGLMQAEEQGITQANVQAKVAEAPANADLPDLRRFLGIDGDLGLQLGLPADFVVRAVQAVGNYGEVFERHVGMGSTLKLERGLNRQWRDGGLIYAPPFR
jgi:general L-amino acid transport system substrate-binding protein